MNTIKLRSILLAGFSIFILLFAESLTASAQQSNNPSDESVETISVSTRLARLSIIVPASKAPLRWEIHDNDQLKTALVVDSPGESNPLSLVIIIDLEEGRGDKGSYRAVERQLADLPRRLHLPTAPFVICASPSAEGLPIRWHKEWPTTYVADSRAAFTEGMNQVERVSNPRRAVLVLTNRVHELPVGIFEEMDERLSHTAAFLFFMTVHEQETRRHGSPGRPIARSNLVIPVRVFVPASADYVSVQFEQFVSLSNDLYTVSYPLTEEEAALNTIHSAEIKAIKTTDGQILTLQKRQFRVN